MVDYYLVDRITDPGPRYRATIWYAQRSSNLRMHNHLHILRRTLTIFAQHTTARL